MAKRKRDDESDVECIDIEEFKETIRKYEIVPSKISSHEAYYVFTTIFGRRIIRPAELSNYLMGIPQVQVKLEGTPKCEEVAILESESVLIEKMYKTTYFYGIKEVLATAIEISFNTIVANLLQSITGLQIYVDASFHVVRNRRRKYTTDVCLLKESDGPESTMQPDEAEAAPDILVGGTALLLEEDAISTIDVTPLLIMEVKAKLAPVHQEERALGELLLQANYIQRSYKTKKFIACLTDGIKHFYWLCRSGNDDFQTEFFGRFEYHYKWLAHCAVKGDIIDHAVNVASLIQGYVLT